MNQIELGIVKCESTDDTGASVTFGLLPLTIGKRYRITATPCDDLQFDVPRCGTCAFYQEEGVRCTTLARAEPKGDGRYLRTGSNGFCHLHVPRPT